MAFQINLLLKLYFFTQIVSLTVEVEQKNIVIDFKNKENWADKLKEGICPDQLKEAIVDFINNYRKDNNAEKVTEMSSSTDVQNWAKFLHEKGYSMHNLDSKFINNYGRDIVITGNWKFGTQSTYLAPVVSFPYFLDSTLENYKKAYKTFHENHKDDFKNKKKDIIDKGDIQTFDAFTRLVWFKSKEFSVGCSGKATDTESWLHIVIVLNKKVGNAHQVDDNLRPARYKDFNNNVKIF